MSAKKGSKYANYDVGVETFVLAWTRSETAEEVSVKLKMPKGIVHARASMYRALGIQLKKMPKRPKTKIDAAKMNLLIQEAEAAEKAKKKDDVPLVSTKKKPAVPPLSKDKIASISKNVVDGMS